MSLQDALTQDHKQFSRCIKQQKSNPAGGWGTSPWWCPKKGRAGGGIGTTGHFGDTGTPSWQLQGGIDGTKKAWKWEWGLEKLREPVPLSDRVQEEGEPSAQHIGGMLRAFWGWRLLPSQTSASAGAVLPPPAPPVDIAQLCWPGTHPVLWFGAGCARSWCTWTCCSSAPRRASHKVWKQRGLLLPTPLQHTKGAFPCSFRPPGCLVFVLSSGWGLCLSPVLVSSLVSTRG